MSQEENLQMFKELMKVPHGKIEQALEIHRTLRDKNPLFYSKMAVWYMDNGNIRDHKVAFVRGLFERPEEVYRDAAWTLLQDLPLQQVTQVIQKQNPRTLRSAVIHYLASMDEGELAYQILRGAKDLRRIVRRLHIPTDQSSNSNLQTIGKELFGNKPELRSIFKKLEQATTEEEVRTLLTMRPRIPPYIAVSALKVRTPAIMKVLIEGMSVNELLQSLNSLGRMGAVKPNLKTIRKKIEKAVSDKRLNASRVNRIKKQLDAELVPPQIFDDLEFVTQEKIKKISKIKEQVVILADASSSMSRSLVAARQLASLLAMACTTKPYIYTCSSTPMEIIPKEWSATGVENAMCLITASGMTPLGSGLSVMLNQGRTQVDAVVIITDGGENCPPYFLLEYMKLEGQPNIIEVQVPGDNNVLAVALRHAQVPFETIELDTVDQYSLDQVIKFIGKVSPFQTIMDIMALELPERPEETKHPDYWKRPIPETTGEDTTAQISDA